MDTSNGNLQQKLLSNRTFPVVVPRMNLRIDNMITPIGRYYQTLLAPVTKEVVADAAYGGAWVNRTLGQIIRTGSTEAPPVTLV